ncbi:MAG TPA: ABC transporter substrate-binding protein, partial [Desulfosporosinus sp.]|nr:ABC transporter substrate-binding protein [Desulfosporosinus sp.]
STDGLTYTFKLRQGVNFSNGDPLTADDVVYSFNRLAAPATKSSGASYFFMIQGFQDVNSGKATTLSGVVKKDDSTVEFHLIAPNRAFLDVVAMPYAFIVDKKTTSALANQADFSKNPIGTGPYKFVEWKQGQDVKVVKNDKYFMKDSDGSQLPYLDSIVWNLGYPNTTALLKYKNNEQDYSTIPAPDFVNTINDPTIGKEVVSGTQNDVWYLFANNVMKPFDKLQVRQALEYAIDKTAILKLINNRGQAAAEMLPPGIPGYKENPSGYTYDQAKAKQLLSDAGYPNGLPDTYTLTYNTTPTGDTMMANIQEQLAAVGIKIKLQGVPFAQYLDIVQNGKEQLAYGGWLQDYPDPDDFLNILFNSAGIPAQNNWGYNNPASDKIWNDAIKNPDLSKELTNYQTSEKQIMDAAAIVPIYHSKTFMLVKPWVHNAPVLTVFPYFDYRYLWVDSAAKTAAGGK